MAFAVTNYCSWCCDCAQTLLQICPIVGGGNGCAEGALAGANGGVSWGLVTDDVVHRHVVHRGFFHYVSFLWRVDNVAVAGEDADVGCASIERYNIS